jgi:hypothetical protein
VSKIYGVALTKEGEPVSGVTVELTGPGGTTETITTGADGIFEHEATVGSWNLNWSGSGSEGEGAIEVAEGEDAEVELEIS